MSDPHKDYYQLRARQELTLANNAASPKVAAIHLEMAARYSSLVAQPQLQVTSFE